MACRQNLVDTTDSAHPKTSVYGWTLISAVFSFMDRYESRNNVIDVDVVTDNILKEYSIECQ